jgi:acetyl-CoA carboxylase carboxyltransferase component
MAVIGQCGGGMSIAAELADFVFIEEGKGSIFVNPQGVVANAIGNNPYVSAGDDGTFAWEEIVDKIRSLVDILPCSSDFTPHIHEVSEEELNRDCVDIDRMLGDARAILSELSDDYTVFETHPDYGQDMITGFIRIAGQPIGVAACNSVGGEKRITSEGCDKAAAIINLCSRFNIPILTITDTEGYQTTSENEKYLPASAGRLLRSLTDSEVPKLNLITGTVVGSAYSLLNSKGLSADYVFMWEGADVSIVDPRQATEVIFGTWSPELEKQYRDTQSDALALARHGFADKVIAAEDSRKYIIGALQTFINSR